MKGEFPMSIAKLVRERVLRETTNGVSELGRKLSLLLADFIFNMSRRKDEEMEKILFCLRYFLERNIRPQEGRELAVFDRLFAIADTWEKQLRDRDETRRLRNKFLLIPGPAMEKFVVEIISRLCEQVGFLEYMCMMVLKEEVSGRDMNEMLEKRDGELGGIEMDIVEGYEKLHIVNHREFEDPIEELLEAKVDELWSQFEL